MAFVTVGQGFQLFRELGVLTTCCDTSAPEVFTHKVTPHTKRLDYMVHRIVANIYTLCAVNTVKLTIKVGPDRTILCSHFSNYKKGGLAIPKTGAVHISTLAYDEYLYPMQRPTIFVTTTCGTPGGQIPVSTATRTRAVALLNRLQKQTDLLFCNASGHLYKDLAAFMAFYDNTYDIY